MTKAAPYIPYMGATHTKLRCGKDMNATNPTQDFGCNQEASEPKTGGVVSAGLEQFSA